MSIKPTLQVLAKMEQLPVLPLSYSPANSDGSATKLVYTLLPEWNPAKGGRGITIVRFTDGITNTVCCLFILFSPVGLLFLFLPLVALHPSQTCEKSLDDDGAQRCSRLLNTASSSSANIFHQLLKCIHNPPEGTSPAEAVRLANEESVLLRAYGRDTSILIDRERKFPPPPTITTSTLTQLSRRMRLAPSSLSP